MNKEYDVNAEVFNVNEQCNKYNSQNEQKKKYKDPIVKLFNQFFYLSQRFLTVTGYIRIFYKKREWNFQTFISIYVLIWFIGISILLIFIDNFISNSLLIFFALLLAYRICEIFLINFWLFVFKQNATSINKKKPKENNVRILLLLFIQYITIIVSYAGIYYIINILKHDVFNVKILSIISYIYFSTVTIATVGYGDIHPCQGDIMCQAIIITEILIGMLFILIFLSTILKELDFRYKD